MNYRLPRTLHIEGSGFNSVPSASKVKSKIGSGDPFEKNIDKSLKLKPLDGDRAPALEPVKFNKLAGQFLIIEEKVDGAGVCLFFDDKCQLQIFHRNNPIQGKEFVDLQKWANRYQDDLFELLADRYILYGEWMKCKHTIFYDKLPHLFLESDIYDKENDIYLSTNHRSNLLNKATYIKRVPVLAELKPQRLDQITNLVEKSHFQSEKWEDTLKTQCMYQSVSYDDIIKETDCSNLMEGLYIKEENDLQVLNRYKYVRPQFIQNILNSGTHLIDRAPIHNLLENQNDIW